MPAWSAVIPVNATVAVLAIGSAVLLFFSSTIDARTARRATRRCAADPTWPVSVRLTRFIPVPSNTPISHFTVRMRLTASSRRAVRAPVMSGRMRPRKYDGVTMGDGDSAQNDDVMNMSTPASRQDPPVTPS